MRIYLLPVVNSCSRISIGCLSGAKTVVVVGTKMCKIWLGALTRSPSEASVYQKWSDRCCINHSSTWYIRWIVCILLVPHKFYHHGLCIVRFRQDRIKPKLKLLVKSHHSVNKLKRMLDYLAIRTFPSWEIISAPRVSNLFTTIIFQSSRRQHVITTTPPSLNCAMDLAIVENVHGKWCKQSHFPRHSLIIMYFHIHHKKNKFANSIRTQPATHCIKFCSLKTSEELDLEPSACLANRFMRPNLAWFLHWMFWHGSGMEDCLA